MATLTLNSPAPVNPVDSPETCQAHEVAYGDKLHAWIWHPWEHRFYPVAYFDWNKSICGQRSPAVVCTYEPGRPLNTLSWPCDPTEVCYRFTSDAQRLAAEAVRKDEHHAV